MALNCLTSRKVSSPVSLGMCMSKQGQVHLLGANDVQGLLAVARQENAKPPRRKDALQRLPKIQVVVADQQRWIGGDHVSVQRKKVCFSNLLQCNLNARAAIFSVAR